MRTLNKVALFSKEYPPHVYGGGKVDGAGLDSVVRYGVTIETTAVKCAGDRSPALASRA